MPQPLPESLKPLEREIATYYRELPRILEAGQEGKYALIRDEQLVRVFDTLVEADEVGHELFGLDRFMAQKIRARDVAGLAPYFTETEERASA
jgi:hypothetical protein